MGFSVMSLVNAALYALQLYVNHQFSREIGPTSRRHPTLITPAPYAFAIWGVIYTLLTCTVVVDCCYPSISIYAPAEYPTFLRLAFAVSCLANMAWVVSFTSEYITVATAILVVLWFSLGLLYVFIVLERQREPRKFGVLRYVLSEVGITIYFAWTCAATLISIAVTIQDLTQAYLSVAAYLVLVSILIVAAVSAVVYGGDIAFGLVVIWALVGVSARHVLEDDMAQLASLSVRASATQGAAIIAAFMAISIVHRCTRRHRMAARYQLPSDYNAAPILNERSNYTTYGSTI